MPEIAKNVISKTLQKIAKILISLVVLYFVLKWLSKIICSIPIVSPICSSLSYLWNILSKCGVNPLCYTKEFTKDVTKGAKTVFNDVKKLF